MTKRDLQRQIDDLRAEVARLTDENASVRQQVRMLNSILYHHYQCGCPQRLPKIVPSCWPVDKRPLPCIDPDDGAPPGDGTVTTTDPAGGWPPNVVCIDDVFIYQRMRDCQVHGAINPVRLSDENQLTVGRTGAMPEEATS